MKGDSVAKSKKKKGSGGPKQRSDIPFVKRMKQDRLATAVAHRDDAHLVELKLALVSLNETEGLGYVRLSRFAKQQQINRDRFYDDPEYERAKLDEAVRQLGFVVEEGRLVCAVDENGKIVPTKTLEVSEDGK